MHLLTAFLLCITSISSSETQTCPASTIAALSVKGALVKAIQCAYSARTGSYTNQADIDVVIVNCLNQIMYLDSTSAPVLGTQCRVCYQGLIMDIIKLSVGRMVSGSFVATVSTFNTDCGITTTLAGQERCMKNVDIRSPMVTFAKCSGYSVIFPASGDLKTRRQFNRVDIFGNMLRLALGTGVVLSGILSQVVSSVNSPPTPSGNLHMQLCYLTFVEDLKEAKILMSDSAIVDCSSSYATNVCLSNGNVVGAMTRFSKCTNFMIDQWYNACDSHSLEKIYGNFDAIKALIPVIVSG
jgi:hypothetical protein